MNIESAFQAMINDVSSADASRRQIDGILDWLDPVRRACAHARQLEAPASCLEVAFAASATHRTWRASSEAILAALAAQSETARAWRAGAEQEAEQRDHLAREADAGAADARREAALARSRAAELAASPDPQAAQGAHAQAGAALERARTLDASAALHREHAAQARQLGDSCMQWEIAALDAHAEGSRVLATEQPIATRVGEAIRAAGGVLEVPRSKRYAAGGRVPVTAGGN